MLSINISLSPSWRNTKTNGSTTEGLRAQLQPKLWLWHRRSNMLIADSVSN